MMATRPMMMAKMPPMASAPQARADMGEAGCRTSVSAIASLYSFLSSLSGLRFLSLGLHASLSFTKGYMASMALSISLASALTSFFISFLACSIASSKPRSIVASPTTIRAASLSSSISPTSLRSEFRHPTPQVADKRPSSCPRKPACQK